MQNAPGQASSIFPNAGQAVLLALGMLTVQIAGMGLLALFAEITGAQPGFEALINPWSLSLINLAAIGLTIAMGLRVTRESPRRFFAIRPFAPGLLPAIATTTLGLVIVLSETDNLIRELVQLLPGFQDLSHLLKLPEHPVGAFLLVVIIAPLTEEYLFRGMMLRGLLTRQRAAGAVWFTALLFGLVHANLQQLFLGVLIGAVFGWWYVRTLSTGPCLIGHAGFNVAAWWAVLFPDTLSVLGFNAPGSSIVHQPWWLTGGGLALIGLGLGWFRLVADSLVTEPPLLADQSIPPLLPVTLSPAPVREPTVPQPPASPAS